ncbi:MAG TPA: hypothetical protein VF832_08985 [Longimicrobiales bacterium]
MTACLRIRAALVLVAALLALPLPSSAQQSPSPTPRDTGRTAKMVMSGLGMGVAGLFGGWIVGGAVEHFGRQALGKPCPPKQVCENGEAAGIIGGFMLGVPLGVHLANHSRGSYWKTTAASAGVAALLVPTGLFLLRHQSGDVQQNLTIWPTIAAQIVVSIMVEKRTTPSTAPIPAPRPQATPSR